MSRLGTSANNHFFKTMKTRIAVCRVISLWCMTYLIYLMPVLTRPFISCGVFYLKNVPRNGWPVKFSEKSRLQFAGVGYKNEVTSKMILLCQKAHVSHFIWLWKHTALSKRRVSLIRSGRWNLFSMCVPVMEFNNNRIPCCVLYASCAHSRRDFTHKGTVCVCNFGF